MKHCIDKVRHDLYLSGTHVYNQLSNCDIIVKMLSKYIILIALLW